MPILRFWWFASRPPILDLDSFSLKKRLDMISFWIWMSVLVSNLPTGRLCDGSYLLTIVTRGASTCLIGCRAVTGTNPLVKDCNGGSYLWDVPLTDPSRLDEVAFLWCLLRRWMRLVLA